MRIGVPAAVLLGLTALITGCSGAFTQVPLPKVSLQERQIIEQTTAPMTPTMLEAHLRANYYRIAYAELGGIENESVEAYATRMAANESVAPWSTLAVLTGDQVQLLQPRFAAADFAQVVQAVNLAQLPLIRRIVRVGQAVSQAAGQSDLTFQLAPELGLNAAADRAGHVYVGPQLVMLTESEDALAFALGHEIAHVVHGHAETRERQLSVIGALQLIAAVAAAADCAQNANCLPPEAAAALTGVAAEGTIRASGYNRDMEREADYYGFRYAVHAGYVPEAGAGFWRQMLALDRGLGNTYQIPFLATHPSSAERVGRLAKWVLSETPTSNSCWTVNAKDNTVCTTCCAAGLCDTSCGLQTETLETP